MASWTASYKGDIWNPPAWSLTPGVTLSPDKAAAILGISRNTLMKYTDDYGLSVIRPPGTSQRRFLVSEIKTLKGMREEISREDILRKPAKRGKRRRGNGNNGGGFGNGLLGSVKTRNKGI